ncbi:hypothetical protein K443DRAFT_3635 [Laccaria amethystina LaAM-08-1]|uniref:Uncharacterized protein n=1 Tax=Laccaria amethystina LaAM-08-1 TaxID=1095629 RepID=A0A0C9Y6N0_9AGAR|nr:hypothetical protein K443DRAFT_8515 [Laccaria amethystina LaAM-08-1]KIK05877.1 hypothetical protein K443DRAFT_3635 [Laccaria amethystina LaAM-08-1]
MPQSAFGGTSAFGSTTTTSAFAQERHLCLAAPRHLQHSGTRLPRLRSPPLQLSPLHHQPSLQQSAFGSATAPSAFGSSTTTPLAFGSTDTITSSAFGKSAFGQSAFGQPAGTSVFGAPAPVTSAFGSTNTSTTSAFGQSAVGKTSQPSAFSAFGPNTGGGTNKAISAFGQPQQTISAFASPQSQRTCVGPYVGRDFCVTSPLNSPVPVPFVDTDLD